MELRSLEPLATSPAAYAFVVLLGLLWGSFANVCIYRWPPSEEFPNGRSVVLPGSHCFACKTPIRWYDNVPLVSWLWLRGKCRTCKAPFSARYLIVEAVTGLLFALAWWAVMSLGYFFYGTLEERAIRFVVYAAFCFVMVVITFIDIDHKLILNKVTIPSIIAFYLLGLLIGRSWYEGLIGAGLGYGLPWTIGEIHYRVTKREGMGLGDSMLLAVIGALLGWKGVLFSLFGGSVIGSVIGIVALATARKDEETEQAEPAEPAEPTEPEEESTDTPSLMRTELPFGPFLAVAALFYLFAEPLIVMHFRLTGG